MTKLQFKILLVIIALAMPHMWYFVHELVNPEKGGMLSFIIFMQGLFLSIVAIACVLHSDEIYNKFTWG